jgi:type IX secretion system PorP/SprF family membrane protein
MRRGFISFLFLISGFVTFGQQDPQFSQYMMNEIYYNPAYAGIPGSAEFSAIHRTQWLGYESTFDGAGNPQTQLISANIPVFKINSGAAFYAINDRLGALNNLEIQGSYAYHLAFKNSKLSFGVRAGVVSQSIDFDQYRWVDPDDPLRQSGKETQIRPDLSAGIYYRAQKYYLSLSASHLLHSEFNFGNDSLANALVTHLYFMAGYDYEINYDFVLRPSVLVKSDLTTYSFDLSLLAYFREKLWFGFSFRQSDAMIALIGYSFLKDNSLRLGYSFDYIINAQEAKNPTSHELLLSYTLPVLSGGEKRIIRTPRFRH